MKGCKLTMASTNTTLFLTLLTIIIIFVNNKCNVEALPKFPAILSFGDSTVDSGNNNYIATAAKGNFLPYGQDFPGHKPTGRFSNGKLATDFITSHLGIKETLPPFLDPNLSDEELISGVSFGSGGSGYDDLTSSLARVISMPRQIQLFGEYVERLKSTVGEQMGNKILREVLVIVSSGTNDFIINFYDMPTRRLRYNISGYQDFLHSKLQDFVKELYNMGCRRIVVTGLPPIGCLPIQLTAKFKNPLDRRCLEDQNADAQSYNYKLQKLLPQIQKILPGSLILHANIYDPLFDMINNPQKYGFVETTRGCCGTGLLEVAFICNPITPTCGKASQFVFWDSVHPSQTTYKYLAIYLEKELRPSITYLNHTYLN
ncbi:GDSL esterase/lipase At2g30310-like [Tripterygium wilfordii]|uniref:GDSL esterase/lipase At2g30310-like n=1 Tax=Tripterygium wilfordii TaxID=458696 RepID=UPI0018F83355|nr:GDSL esterase/lipase At2g30310-like [Tripterygium wilfordii]